MKSKSLISLLLCFALVFTSFTFAAIVPAGAADVTAASTGEHGSNYTTEELILQCWNWPVSVIRSKLYEIADAGFTAIQTSPVNVIVGSGNNTADNTVSNWYQFYQPKSYTIGNKITTQAEFTTLCSEAHELGLKVIVDVALNHTTNQTGQVADYLQHYRGNGNIDNWDDRWQQTQKDITGMPDLDTSNSTVQSEANGFLKSLISCGADGFRYDAAKHIELPYGYELSNCPTSDYWNNVLSGVNDKFSYGEVLAGQNVPLTGYAKFMNVTGSAYSDTVRNNISNNVLNASDLKDYKAGLGADKLVFWVESHDNYKPNDNGNGNFQMPKYQIVRAWAALAAQGVNAMYLARPYGSSTSDWDGSGNTYDGGNGDYFDAEVVGVNKFHNVCKGTNVADIYNYNGNNQILVIRRGNKGVCIINTGSSTVSVTVGDLANGSYTDFTHNTSYTASNGGFTVSVAPGVYPIAATPKNYTLSDYRLFGYINGANYSCEENSAQPSDYAFDANGQLTATFTNDSYVAVKTHDGAQWYMTDGYPGDSATSATLYNTSSITNVNKLKVPANTQVTFTLTKGSNDTFTLSYTVASQPTTEPTSATQPSTSGGTTTTESVVYLKPNANWIKDGARFAAYFYGTSGEAWVGMSSDTVSGLYKCTIPSGTYENLIFCRMNGSTTANNWDNKWNQTSDLTVSGNVGKGYVVADGTWDEGGGEWKTYVQLGGTEPTEPTAPPTYNYTVVYKYTDGNNAEQTITKTVNSTLTDASEIAELNNPSGTISNMTYTYSIGSATKNGTSINVNMTREDVKYTVTYNGTVKGTNYKYLDKVTVESSEETGFLLDGEFIKRGTKFTCYVTGNLNITTDSTAVQSNNVTLNQTGSYFSDSKISFEFLATANMDSFKRMGVVFARSKKTDAQIASAVNSVISGDGVSNKIAVHNSSVDWANESGLYQFIYAPYVALSNVPEGGADLFLYAFAVTDSGDVITSGAAKSVRVYNALA